MIRTVFVFMSALVASGVLTFGLATLDASPWPVVFLMLAVGAALSRVEPLEVMLPSALVMYASAFVAGFVVSLPESPSPSVSIARIMGTATLALIGALAFLVFMTRSKGLSRAVPWLLLALGMGAFVGYISGDAGGADPMRNFLSGVFSERTAEAAVWVIRKSVHVGFYGLMAFAVFRAAKAVRVSAGWPALLFALAHGSFDEFRQYSASTVRYGNPGDILFDLTGATVALFLAGAFRSSGSKRTKIE